MPQCRFGGTTFDYPDVWSAGAKVKIATEEGSTVAVNADDVLAFVHGAYIIPMRRIKEETKPWQDGILGP